MNTNIKRLVVKIDKEFHDEIKRHARRNDYENTKQFVMAAIIKLMSEQKGKSNEKEKRS